MNSAIIIVCSRPESRRLPGKVFREIAGKPVINHIADRLKATELPVFWAVPPKHKALYEKYLEGTRQEVVTGNPDSPLHRMAEVLQLWSPSSMPEWVIRVTHDDILIDAETVLHLLANVRQAESGYGITPGIAEGAGVEVIHSANILKAAQDRKANTEYVSYFVKGEGMPFPRITRLRPRPTIERPYRLTLDYPEDEQLLEIVLRRLGPDSTVDMVCSFLEANPHLLKINKRPDITVYTCVHNGEQWLRDTIHSVLASLPSGCEYLIVDDHSTDSSPAIAAEFVGPGSPVRLILNKTNHGLASSSNIALREARGKYVMRVDADDILMPPAIGYMLALAQDKNSDIVYSAYHEIDGVGRTVKTDLSSMEHRHAGCALMNSGALNEVRFRDGLRHWDGLDLYNRMSGSFTITYVDRPLWFYRKHKDSLSKDTEERRDAKARLQESN